MATDKSGTKSTEAPADYSVVSGGGSVESGLAFKTNFTNKTQAVTKHDAPKADNIYNA